MIDKDLAAAVLAKEIGADVLVISTSVPKVCLDFGKSNERPLDSMTVAEANCYIAEGHFPAGSMLPKVRACIHFLQAGGREAIITSPDFLSAALNGETGTRIMR